jgi:peptidyl-prolyl cis-trans isomerase C
MYSISGTCRAAPSATAILASLVCSIAAVSAHAETVRTVNGEAIDSTVVDFYVQNRTQKAPEQVTPDERSQLLDELTDIYVLSTQDAADEASKDPNVRAQLELQHRGVLAQAVASDILLAVDVSEEEIQAEYESQSKLAPPMQFKARHILVESQGEATDLITRLDNGADFVELAKDKSTDSSAQSGGDLGWFAPNQMVKPFSDAVAVLEDGEYTKSPVQTDFGWHVILREDSRQSEAPALDGVRDEIVQVLQQRKFQEELEALRSKATVE